MRTRRCPVCKTKFEPARQGQKCCPDPDCAVTLGRQIKEKADRIAAKAGRAADRQKRIDQKTTRQLHHDAQFWFNRFIRLRDAGQPCISCCAADKGTRHASHYMNVSSHPELRYEERNCYASCSQCNTHLSGNLIEYRKNLVATHGEELLLWLEGPHEPKRYRKDDLIEIRDRYREKCRILEAK